MDILALTVSGSLAITSVLKIRTQRRHYQYLSSFPCVFWHFQVGSLILSYEVVVLKHSSAPPFPPPQKNNGLQMQGEVEPNSEVAPKSLQCLVNAKSFSFFFLMES